MAHAAGLRTNTDFQLEFFIEGSAHTPDGKWALLWMQWNVLQQKVRAIPAYHIKREAMALKLQWEIENKEHPWERMQATAELLELEIGNEHWQISEEAWTNETDFVKARMDKVEPDCLYRDLPFLQRCEAAQRDEWLYELCYKAENYIISTGVIPHDYLDAMRMHPDFRLKILPHINNLCTLRTNYGGHPAAMLQKLPQLLTGPSGTPEPERVLDAGTLKEGEVTTVLSLRHVN
jgi:hypothetical protein